MPEPYWPKRKNAYRLRDALPHSPYAKMRCGYCKTERWYLVEELIIVFGNIECDEVAYARDWRCIKCDKKNTVDMNLANPSAAELQKIKLRRIARIEYHRRVSWRDD